jgi:hypothetical protein
MIASFRRRLAAAAALLLLAEVQRQRAHVVEHLSRTGGAEALPYREPIFLI